MTNRKRTAQQEIFLYELALQNKSNLLNGP